MQTARKGGLQLSDPLFPISIKVTDQSGTLAEYVLQEQDYGLLADALQDLDHLRNFLCLCLKYLPERLEDA
ncbi:MAG: hypothetical protein B7Z80_24685 [Rhodospirillales bacterium 20-64-7]|nr:MAG: hypothetical protein B7Z80_24685 [Rhodospirillales bacterium 20-64-7]